MQDFQCRMSDGQPIMFSFIYTDCAHTFHATNIVLTENSGNLHICFWARKSKLCQWRKMHSECFISCIYFIKQLKPKCVRHTKNYLPWYHRRKEKVFLKQPAIHIVYGERKLHRAIRSSFIFYPFLKISDKN